MGAPRSVPAADSAIPPTPTPRHLSSKLMGTKRPQVSSCKNWGGAIKNKDQGFGFSTTLAQGRGHRAYLAQLPWPRPSGKQEAAMGARGSVCLTTGGALSWSGRARRQADCPAWLSALHVLNSGPSQPQFLLALSDQIASEARSSPSSH